jgi:hypothetical protein
MSSRRPAPRQDRSHKSFLRNLRIDPALVRRSLKEAWHANEPYDDLPDDRIESLIEMRYGREEWYDKF